MKKMLLAVTVLVATAFKLSPVEPLTQTERDYAINYFNKTKNRLLADTKGLSEAQLNFKANDSSWSAAQCIEHIALAESLIWNWGAGVMKSPATPEKRSEVKITTDQIIPMITDRSHKFKAPEVLKPSGKFANSKEALNAFVSRRDSTIAYVSTTQDDLKGHFTVHPAAGTMDIYQLLIFMAAHSERHTMQLEEVKANPAFPKK